MTTRIPAAILFGLTCFYAADAQEPSTPSAPPEETPALSIVPEDSPTPSPAAQQTPPAKSFGPRNVRISFVPPPLDGTISLGVYDKSGKLVRVLHQKANLSEFTIGADGLVTQWDGKNDNAQDLPAGRYRGRGYVVGPLKVEDLGDSSPPPAQAGVNASVSVRLVRNPLRKNKTPPIELGVGFDSDGTYLKSGDGLPLFTVSEAPNVTHAWITAKNDNAVDVWQDDGTKVHPFRISNVDQMMAFDCGDFELK